LHTSIPFLLHSLRSNGVYDKTILGVVSNSDCRVSSILNSLGVLVRSEPQDAYQAHNRGKGTGKNGIIDFLTLSYNVGVEKPHPRIFEAAFEEARRLDADEEREWTKVHVGDDIGKDVRAAGRAGWRGVLWDGEGESEKVLKQILGI
jgi:hypothetical protein